jgi:formylglycine-generating enzyme required for sulfatase activity
VEITFAEGFWLMETPVTQALWMAVMGTNPSRFVSPDRPIESVSWNDAQAFLEQANARVAGLNLRLPSEAEWEYACRAGTTAATHAGAMEILGERNAPVLEAIAWYGGNSGVGFELEEGHDVRDWPERAHAFDKAGTRPVRGKAPTPWGCHDLLGNVWEWCADVWSDSHAGADPSGRARSAPDQEGERLRVVRGGSWRDRARGVRAAYRDGGEPVGRLDDLGFRCARGQAMESGRQAGGPEGRGRRSGGAGAAEPPAGRSDGRRAERGEERLRDGLE